MSGFSRFLGFLTVIVSSCASVQAGPTAEKAEPAGYRLTVELKDGSRVIGKSGEEHLQFRSASLGEIKLSLEKVRSIEGLGKAKQAKLVTAGNDTLVVEFAAKNIKLETAFGEVKLPVAMIKSLRVSAIGEAGRPMEGLIGFWSGDGNADDSVAGNKGRNENVSFTDGVAGQAFSFSPNHGSFGIRTCIDIPDKPAYVLTHALTIEGWIRPRGDGNVIFTRGDRRSGFDPYTLSMDGSHTLVFQITGDSGESVDVRADNIPYCEWTHIAGTWDAETKMMRVYTNGMLAAEKETSIRPIGELIQNLTPGVGIGNVNDGMNNFPFAGDIGEIGLYDRALSEREVNAIYAEHAATADGRAELLPRRANPSFGFQDGPGPN